MATIVVPTESASGETRAAVTPESVARFVGHGFSVAVQAGVGAGAHFDDAAYAAAGAEVLAGDALSAALGAADLVLTVAGPSLAVVKTLKAGAVLVGSLSPHSALDRVAAMRDGGVSAVAMELVPRITRAQAMDALSSQASIAGYKAVLLAAARLDKYFPLLMTAAGTVKPARVVVMGAGVAGLQAVATARRLGAVVHVSDIRDVVKEQVESLGGRFIALPEQEESGEGQGGYARQVTPEFLAEQRTIVTGFVAQADVVITTALVPGRRAPKLVTQAMVEGMRPGAVIVDLAVAQGGNCELSVAGEEVVHAGVKIIGHPNLPATMPRDATILYAKNVVALVESLGGKDGAITLNLEDEVVAGALLVHQGEVRHGPTQQALAALGAAEDKEEGP